MKHALFAALILLAGCADEPERAGAPGVTYVPAAGSEQQPLRQTALATTPPPATGSLPDPKVARERGLRNQRQTYAQGLEQILLTNGMKASVIVQEESRAGPTPALMFFGHFSRSFVQRAVTDGAVLQRARELGFRSVEFFDRESDGNYLFDLPETGPLPRCAAFNRLCT